MASPWTRGSILSSDAGGPAEFANSAEHTIMLTVVVAGGVRHSTARRRTERVAEKLADAASRTKHILDVTARAGPSHLGEVHFSHPVAFPAANSGESNREGGLGRWVDADFALFLERRRAERLRARERRDRDRRRRLDVGCLDHSQLADEPCRCVYCRPAGHLRALSQHGEDPPIVFAAPRCVCGQYVPAPGVRCVRHRRARLVLLPDDPEELRRFAAREWQLNPDLPEPLTRDAGHELELPDDL